MTNKGTNNGNETEVIALLNDHNHKLELELIETRQELDELLRQLDDSNRKIEDLTEKLDKYRIEWLLRKRA